MSVAFDIQTLLQAEGIEAEVNNVNMSRQNTVAIMETGGSSPIRCHGHRASVDDRPSFQIIIHNETKPAAATLAEHIINTLDGRANETINGEYYTYIELITPPTYLGRTQTERGETNEYSLNFTTRKLRRRQ